ncbi:Rab5-interacting protein, putative [Plasmodium chabaudi chabaudi]|uniref:Rab5-interacting protein, putative n=2 Tax=Plasmodium chabaudi TaxID=5825 RepID=A0A077TMZ7_PLACU|nr:Rab5-interacting protein, putative [Plasmodium chabaudi chabaudi]SCM01099.1 Rab5-interacting protein, putative [Plasmodium chabaudi chabaudi]SCM02687.1 Rab5-interacting protein, putative [Plasmodium chabaudi chabaudi]SCM05678.1 Rab5-interacting protein, putative [Plasmodium chabaudi adami]VTZ68124.1 Rab5-interacting protein, putative [Plasmodium chabaudi chabaudi]|eukprot:XP_016653660.1 Rab5-interacting protein, putative [Plasmodium chabaudi chabaudi]
MTKPAKNGSELFKKLLRDKLTKNEMDDVFFYYKQIIGIIAGVICGIVGIKGILGFMFFLIFQFFLSVALYNKKIDENYYMDNYSIVTSNLSVAIPAFVVSWITMHTVLL